MPGLSETNAFADSRHYRRLLAAMAFFLVVHALALVAMGAILMRGIGPAGDVASFERAHFIAANPWLWRLGWLPWQLCALSDLLVCVLLMDWTRVRGGFGWACVSLVLVLAAAIPEQWSEWRMITEQVQVAAAVVRGEAPIAAHAELEQHLLIVTGSFSATVYVLMTGAWMLAIRSASRAVAPPAGRGNQSAVDQRRGAWPGWLALALLLVFLGACASNWLGQIPGDDAASWYAVASACNGIAFPGLIAWTLYYTGWLGELERRARGIAPATAARWPTRPGRIAGLVSRALAPLAVWDGVRDLMRVMLRPLPFLHMVSDVRDVVYLSWLVPVERVRHLVDERLQLDVRDDLTAVSILTYRHGHFGLRIMGPARRLTPSPVQSNWRLYLQPPSGEQSSEGIAFFANAIDNPLYCLGARLMADGLPVHLLSSARHERDGDTVRTELAPGDGSAPDLHTVVREVEAGETDAYGLPPAFAERFADWHAAVDYLVRQERGERIHEAVGLRSVSAISIPIDPAQARPAVLEQLKSETLVELTADCDGLAFVVPEVKFSALGERWRPLSG